MTKTIAKFVNQKLTQPKYGYVPVKSFESTAFFDRQTVNMDSHFPYQIVTKAVQLLARKTLVNKPLSEVQLSGAVEARDIPHYLELHQKLDGNLSDNTIKNACKLAGYDIIAVSHEPDRYPVSDIDPNIIAINSIRILTTRTINYYETRGVLDLGVTFPSAYNTTIESGTADVLTRKGISNIRISKEGVTKVDTVQTLIGHLLAEKEKENDVNSVCGLSHLSEISIFNPRWNREYLLAVEKLDARTLYALRALTGIA